MVRPQRLAAVAAVITWLWDADRPPPQQTARVADALELPVNASGSAAPSWWATLIMLVVDASVFAAFVFTFVHASMRLEVCPPPRAALPAWRWSLLACGALLAGSGAMWLARRAIGKRRLGWAVLAAMLCLTAGFAAELGGHLLAGLDPTAEAWSAGIAAMLAYQGLHVVAMLVVGLFVWARAACGRLTFTSRATIDNACLMWHYTTLQGIVLALTVQLAPRMMG